ncbi:MAG: PKD domain-containing protein [Armatimonadota bacterium]
MKRFYLPLILLIASVAFLTGCGGGGGGGNDGGGTPDPISVIIQGPVGSINGGDTVTITATVSNATTNTAVTWSIVEGQPAGGTLSNILANSVVYTAPNVDSGTFHVTATSQEDPTKSATVTITVNDLPPPPPGG